MTHDVPLDGCTPVPLANYLKGLGVFRLVAEQADPTVMAYWQDERLVLRGQLDAASLRDFLAERYAPTPILAPWNGGSGFHPGDNRDGIDAIAAADCERLASVRDAIHHLRDVLARLDIAAKPAGTTKNRLLTLIRAEADDTFLDWLDAAVLLTEEDPRYPPLLGTGGNDGRLDFTNNFVQRLAEVMDPTSGDLRGQASAHLGTALFADATPGMVGRAIGQFQPGAAGGPNATTGFESGSLINPWDFILMLEGSLLFAATATRRHEQTSGGRLSYPFTVHATGSGSGATSVSDEGPARPEIWMPLWEHPLGIAELRALLGEGRATLQGRGARNGLDFARAIAGLGVERGISAFQRYGFMMRSGKAYLATPLNRFPVRRNPDAALIDQLDRNDFLERFRRFARGKNATNATQALAHTLEDALFELAGDSRAGGVTPPARVQTVLERLGGVVLYLARSTRAREACPVLPQLTADWHMAADDGSAEFRIAAALAGIGGSGPRMIHHLLPLDSPEKGDRWRCGDDSPLHVWGQGDLDRNTAAVLQRRLLDSAARHEDKPLAGKPPASLAAVAALLQRATDDARIVRLMVGLALVRRPPVYLPRGGDQNAPLPAAYALIKALFTPDEQLRRIGRLREGEHMPLPPAVPRLLNADRPEAALREAQQRLRGSGQVTRLRHLSAAGLDGPRLLTALVVPLDDRALGRLLDRVLQAPHADDEQTTA